MSGDVAVNGDQASYWNEQAGPRWVAMERELDAQLEPFGREVMKQLAIAPDASILDVGCGAGATSRMLADRGARVLGVDISAPLLARARQHAEGLSHLRFELADAQTFAFERGAFDAVFSRFGVMFFADPVEAFRNLRSALRPGAELAFVCWRAMRENPSFYLPLEAAMPHLPARKAMDPHAPGPFALADRERIARIASDAGFRDVDVIPHDRELIFAAGRDLEGAVDVALELGPLSRALQPLDDATRARIRAAVRAALLPHHTSAGVTLPSATWLVHARS